MESEEWLPNRCHTVHAARTWRNWLVDPGIGQASSGWRRTGGREAQSVPRLPQPLTALVTLAAHDGVDDEQLAARIDSLQQGLIHPLRHALQPEAHKGNVHRCGELESGVRTDLRRVSPFARLESMTNLVRKHVGKGDAVPDEALKPLRAIHPHHEPELDGGHVVSWAQSECGTHLEGSESTAKRDLPVLEVDDSAGL